MGDFGFDGDLELVGGISRQSEAFYCSLAMSLIAMMVVLSLLMGGYGKATMPGIGNMAAL